MVQRTFWSTQHPVEIIWRYVVDPTRPDSPPAFSVAIHDQSGGSMAYSSALVPLNVVHDAVVAFFAATWDLYLYSDPSELVRTTEAIAREWRKLAATERPQR